MSIQVTVADTTGLERQLRVEIPEEQIQGEVAKRLDNLAQTVRVPGFRPGKVPLKVVAQRFGRQMRDEVVGEVVQSSFLEALSQEKLRPAGTPTIEPVDLAPGQGLIYTATFDVLPEVILPPFESLKISRPVAEVVDADVDTMIETLRKQRKTWHEVGRAATSSDRVIVDFEGTVDGETLEGGTASEMPLELGASRMIEGFEAGLVGMCAGEDKQLDLVFPEDYHVAKIAGKAVCFQVKVGRVEEAVLPALDEEFAKSFGVTEGGIDVLRGEVRGNMQRELGDAIGAKLRQLAMDALLEDGDLELPRSMVREEIDKALARRREELANSGLDPAQAGLDASMFAEEARRRVTLGLVLAEIIKVHEISPDPERVRQRIESMASTYQQPDEVVNWYYSDRSRLSEIESVVLEGQVVEWILERADVSDVPTSFDELLNPGQT